MITGFCGANGSGKTLSALAMAQRFAAKLDRPLYSNVRATWTDKRGREYSTLPLHSLDQLAQLSECEVLLDEVVSGLNARETQTLKPEHVLALNRMRHADVGVYWTAPDWSLADIMIRRVTTEVYVYSPVASVKVEGQRWRRTVLTKRRRYRTSDDLGGRLPKHQSGFPRLVRLSRLPSFGTYQTRDADMARMQGGGRTCVVCGGKRHVEVHDCQCDAD